MSPDLPPRALQALEAARARFGGKTLKVSLVYKLDPMHIRRALSAARREAADDQVACALYAPKGGEALIIVPADELASLLARGPTQGSPPPS